MFRKTFPINKYGALRLRTSIKMVQNRVEEGQNEFSSEAVTELIKVVTSV